MQIGGLGTNSTATLGGTSQIQKSAKKTVENAMTDDLLSRSRRWRGRMHKQAYICQMNLHR